MTAPVVVTAPVVAKTLVLNEPNLYIGWLPADVQAQLHATYDHHRPDGSVSWSPYWIVKKTWSDGSITYTPQ